MAALPFSSRLPDGVIGDAAARNRGAVRAFAAAGFVKQGIMPGYEDDPMLYMTIDR